MIKSFIIAAAVATSLLAVVPANAAITSSDCNYARQNADNVGFEHNNYSYNAHLIQQCLEAGK